LALATQVITLPFFLIDWQNYEFNHIHPYNFEYSDLLKILIPIFIYLILTNILYFALQQIFGKNIEVKYNYKENKNSINNSWLIVLIVLILIPVNLLFYEYGISIAGISPPNLPFKVSGIAHYLTKYFIPFILSYMYWRGKKNTSAFLILIFYSYILGITTISRSIPISIMGPLILISLYKKDNFKSIFSIINMIIIFMITTQIRNDIYTIEDNQLVINREYSPFENVINVFTNNNNFLGIDAIIQSINGIFNRIDGFQNLVFSLTYNSEAVAEPWIFIVRMISWGLGDYSSDNHNIQWAGQLLPEGFVLGGGLLSNALMMSHFNYLWLTAASFITAFLAYFMEFFLFHLQTRMKFEVEIKNYLTIFFCFILFTGCGAPAFIYPLILLAIINLILNINFK
jgi:hypothetical protein